MGSAEILRDWLWSTKTQSVLWHILAHWQLRKLIRCLLRCGKLFSSHVDTDNASQYQTMNICRVYFWQLNTWPAINHTCDWFENSISCHNHNMPRGLTLSCRLLSVADTVAVAWQDITELRYARWTRQPVSSALGLVRSLHVSGAIFGHPRCWRILITAHEYALWVMCTDPYSSKCECDLARRADKRRPSLAWCEVVNECGKYKLWSLNGTIPRSMTAHRPVFNSSSVCSV